LQKYYTSLILTLTAVSHSCSMYRKVLFLSMLNILDVFGESMGSFCEILADKLL